MPGYEQGEQFLGSIDVTTDSNGDASFDPTFTPTVPAVAMFTWVTPIWGSYVSATATGDSSDGSTSQFSAYVPVQVEDTISLSSSLNPSQDGQSVTFTAAVASTLSGGTTPTGAVTFLDNGNLLATATLDGTGTATFTTSTLADGGNSITAVYSGDSNYLTGTSAPLVQVVQPSSGGITLTASADPVSPGQTFTLMTTVSGSAGTPTGTVTFMDGDMVLGTATLDDNGLATLDTSLLTAGDHDITASYSGDSNYSSGTSSDLTETVTTASTVTALTSSLNPAAAGAQVTFSVEVGSETGIPTGTVAFYDGSTLLDTETLDNVGTASFSTTDLALGDHSITAAYSGDGNFAASTAR